MNNANQTNQNLKVVVFIGDYHTVKDAAKDGALHVSDPVHEDLIPHVINGAKAAAGVYSSDIKWEVMDVQQYEELQKMVYQ